MAKTQQVGGLLGIAAMSVAACSNT